MSKIISVGTAQVPFEFDQNEVKNFARALFSKNGDNIERILGVFDNSMIDSRRFVHPREWFESDKNFKERSESYLSNSISLSKSAINDCLNGYNGDIGDFDHIIFVSSTGLACPSIDALLVNELRLDTHVKRTPIWGLGCAGGAAGLSRALEYTKAYPESAVMLVALEICSLAFHGEDYSKSNIVSLALFSDGAAAVIVAGKENKLYESSKLKLIESLSTTYYNSLDVMGWEILSDGFKAIFSKDIPSIVRDKVRSNIEELLTDYSLSVSDLKHYVVHPGGPKVLNEYESSLGLKEGTFRHARKVLREHGNMSSPTVLYVLKEFLQEQNYSEEDYGIISALGPGFSSELILFTIE
ncbi:MAG: 3-oxoacyl-[acyl-carrier-protein] synthase III C-terminal domain-containing protein [Deltaproteobacteria bacterium]